MHNEQANPQAELPPAAMDTLGYFEFFGRLIFSPREFFSACFRAGPRPYLFSLLVFLSLTTGYSRVEQTFVKFLQTGREIPDVLTNWPGYFGCLLFAAVTNGPVHYLFGGLFYKLRVKWSKGHSTFRHSALLYLYSVSPAIFVSLIDLTLALASAGDDPLRKAKMLASVDDAVGVDSLVGLFAIAATAWSIQISYTGVCLTTDVDHRKAKFWFFWLPMGYFAFTLVVIYVLAAVVMTQQAGPS